MTVTTEDPVVDGVKPDEAADEAADGAVPVESVEEDLETPVSLEPERVTAPVKEVLPVIIVGDWVRLKSSRAVPTRLANRTAAVTAAVVRTTGEPDNLSDSPYQYQKSGDVFNVYVRETGETLVNLTRASFVSHGPTQADVDRHLV